MVVQGTLHSTLGQNENGLPLSDRRKLREFEQTPRADEPIQRHCIPPRDDTRDFTSRRRRTVIDGRFTTTLNPLINSLWTF